MLQKKCYPLSFSKLGGCDSTRALQSSLFLNPGSVAWAIHSTVAPGAVEVVAGQYLTFLILGFFAFFLAFLDQDKEVISRIFLVSALLSTSAEICFVSRMRDFFLFFLKVTNILLGSWNRCSLLCPIMST